MTELVTPTVNINGTSQAELMRLYCEALYALHIAENKLANCYPHGRDYQTMEPLAYLNSRNQHWARMESLHKIRHEIETIAERISNQ